MNENQNKLIIYIDTNCINARNTITEMSELSKLYDAGKIFINKTDIVDTELQEGYKLGLKESIKYTESFGVGVVGHSRVDHCVAGTEEDDKKLEGVLIVLWGEKERSDYTKQEIRDAMNIITARRYGADFFVTQEKVLMGKDSSFGMRIGTPKECLKFLKEKGISIS